MDAINRQALRILKLLGNTTSKRVTTTVGPEQEYFLVERSLYEKRPDLILAGRTLFGALPPKGQEMEDHYFGDLKERVSDFMRELNCELWKLGVAAKTQHNEVAPNQFELAPLFSTSNVAADSNQLVMDALQKVAKRHDLVCLLHEKPFKGVNGSGKHNNWSMATDDGINLLNPGTSPHENAQFLLFLSAVLKAVDTYAPILRATAANTGNDHRLGANEAPPAIVSVFLGDQLAEILEKISRGEAVVSSHGVKLEIGVTSLPSLPKDLTDRNRTSPFAFTGNKFEFRMVPSSESISGPNVALNTTVAEILSQFADQLEKAKDLNEAIKQIVVDTYKKHKRIIFNGNGYSEEWKHEAEKRGLPNISCTVDALPEFLSDASVSMFTRHKVLSREELTSRTHIYLEKYAKQINIEAGLMIEMAMKSIYPAVTRYAKEIADSIRSVKEAAPEAETGSQEALLKELMRLAGQLRVKTTELEDAVREARHTNSDILSHAKAFRQKVFFKMDELRTVGDTLERIVEKTYWPFPTYEELLFTL